MPKLLLEYKEIPTIFYHSLKSVTKVTFIVVYTLGNGDYTRRDFSKLSDAIDFNPINVQMLLRFVYLDSGDRYVDYRYMRLRGDRIELEKEVTFEKNPFNFEIRFGLDDFEIKKSLIRGGDIYIELKYLRRKIVTTKKEYDYIDKFYELVPRFEDIFLETLFFLHIITSKPVVRDIKQLEAYFLQAKVGYEEKKNRTSDKTKETEIIEKESEKPLELPNLIGLEEVKLELQELKALAHFRKKRFDLGLPVTPSTLHMVFTGNPGTGKTTVARLLGKIYYEIGLLTSSKVVEVSRADLVGEYVGHTAPKTKKVFDSAIGGILFIDEAYSLFKQGNDFGNEAVETILKLMEDNREKVVVIIAGYPKATEELLASNPGLKSRFSKTLHFRDYNKEELIKIFEKMVSDYKNILTGGARYKVEYIIDKFYDSGAFNSNARTIRNIFEETIKRQFRRLSKLPNPNQGDMTTFVDSDIPDEVW